ncbi:MAG: protein kinase, partial [Anaerolineales bacterium]
MSAWVGKTLGKVQIESLIGRGGVAEVYLGTHTTLERKVAVKILRSLDEENTGALVRFEREARAVAKLRHPNIVQVYDFDTQDSTPYLVMEYVPGPSLSKYLHVLHQNKLRLPIHQTVKLIRAVASALQYAHTNGVIHRDVKPGNILLTSPTASISLGQPLPEDFEPVLTDFGLVRFLDSGRQTTTGHIAGTPSYMSPEQSRGETTDGRTDIYALGIVLYEMLSGTLPFEGESSVSILLKQVTQQHAPIPGLAPAIQGVLDRALAKDLNDRYQSAMDFANALCTAVEMKDGASTLQFAEVPTLQFPESTQQPVKPAATPRPQRRWLSIALVAIAILGSGFFFTQGLPFVGTQDITPTVPSATHALPTASLTITPSASSSPSPVPVVTGPIAILRFKNGKSLADQATLIARALPVPPPGSQYEIWLNGEDGRLSLGVFVQDERGQGELTYSNPDGLNLISRYDTVEITFEPTSDGDPEPSGLLAYSYT